MAKNFFAVYRSIGDFRNGAPRLRTFTTRRALVLYLHKLPRSPYIVAFGEPVAGAPLPVRTPRSGAPRGHQYFTPFMGPPRSKVLAVEYRNDHTIFYKVDCID